MIVIGKKSSLGANVQLFEGVVYQGGTSHKSQISGLSTTCLTVRFSLTPCAEDLDKGGTGSATASHAHKTYSSLSEELCTHCSLLAFNFQLEFVIKNKSDV